MDFDKIKNDIKNTPLESVRVDNEVYLEAVVRVGALGEIVRLIENSIGKPAWPSKAKLGRDARALTDKFGGLRNGQTLFYLNEGGVSIFAMLWPWQDGERVTIKLGRA